MQTFLVVMGHSVVNGRFLIEMFGNRCTYNPIGYRVTQASLLTSIGRQTIKLYAAILEIMSFYTVRSIKL